MLRVRAVTTAMGSSPCVSPGFFEARLPRSTLARLATWTTSHADSSNQLGSNHVIFVVNYAEVVDFGSGIPESMLDSPARLCRM